MGAFNDYAVAREADEDFADIGRTEIRKIKALIYRRNVLERQAEKDNPSDAILAEIAALEWALDLAHYHRASMPEFRKHRDSLDETEKGTPNANSR